MYDILVIEFPTQRKDEQVAKLDEQDAILNFVPLQMIVPFNVSTTIAKIDDIKKIKTTKKASPSNKYTSIIYKPSSEPHVEPPTKLNIRPNIDIHAFDMFVNDILNEDHGSTKDLRDGDPQNEESEVQGKKSVEVDQDNKDDDILIANIMKRIIKNVTKPHDNDTQEKEEEEEAAVRKRRKLQVGTHATLEYGEGCLCQLVKHVEGDKDPNLAKVVALRRAMEVTIDCCFRSVHFETDNLNLAHILNNSEEDRSLREVKFFRQFKVSYTN
ncbi:unnamed protein product [Vicia faba]|uniref:RNase H type-1 domain-containing protein n=1 Tax=Vicia faba TaxID=3906 RepID=A0AAV1A731_VICFA|nr:unnamed protein product [Vicia faba]